jgi:uncharacterized protein (UPF0264 family)
MAEKVKLSIILEIPVKEGEERPIAFTLQNVFDDFVNYAATKHLTDALHWGIRDEDVSKHHELWAEIINISKKTMTLEKVV